MISFSSRMEWTTVSNAFCRSIETLQVIFSLHPLTSLFLLLLRPGHEPSSVWFKIQIACHKEHYFDQDISSFFCCCCCSSCRSFFMILSWRFNSFFSRSAVSLTSSAIDFELFSILSSTSLNRSSLVLTFSLKPDNFLE